MYLEIVTNRQALKLRKLGFDYPTQLFYDYDGFLRDKDTGLPAPTQAIALQWMREKYDKFSAGINVVETAGKVFYQPRLLKHSKQIQVEYSTDYIDAEYNLLEAFLNEAER